MSRTTTVFAALLAATALTATTASAAPTQDRPTPEAKAAGITEPGDARMGWKERSQQPTARSSATVAAPAGVPGIDVSNWQGSVDWTAQWNAGKRFAYVKATEGTGYTSPSFAQQYNGSYNVGMVRGSYHFALPNTSSGATQANYFVDHGGGWSADGKTLPGVHDVEWNPYGSTCYGLTQSGMRTWINSFLNQYKARTGRYPVIYTNTNWWNECVGHDTSFAAKSPLWIARYSSSAGTMPTGWGAYSFWQYTDSPIDQNVWNGSLDRLRYFAKN